LLTARDAGGPEQATQADRASAAQAPPGAAEAPVTRGVVQSIVSGSGNLAPARQLNVDFQTSGRITHIYTREGRHVEKGELLARLDPRSAQVAVSQAQATLADDEEKLDAIVNPAPTPSPTPSSGGRSETASTTTATATATPSAASEESAQADVDSAQLALDQANADLDATELRAPMAGTVASIDGEVGDDVGGSGGSSPSSSPQSSSSSSAAWPA
jgi:multidrug efflux pump subunit AcrA (membrane-fusion protein)